MGSAKTENKVLQGIAASPGIAIGRVKLTDRRRVAVVEEAIDPESIPDEIERFTRGLQEAKEELKALKEQIARQRGPEHLYVIDTHLLIMEDSMLTTETVSGIANERLTAESALKRTLLKFKDFFAGIEDEYFRERSSDVETVVERVLRKLVGHQLEPICGEGGKNLIVAHDLSPSDILQIDKESVIGFVTDLGGKTSHSAILARALEIPAVIGLETITAEVSSGDSLIIDGAAGLVVINPNQETFRDYLKRKQHYDYISRELLKLKDLPAETLDGHRITLKGNIEFLEEKIGRAHV